MANYEKGEELFIKESETNGPIKIGQEIKYKGYKFKIKEKDEYPSGVPGWWAKVMGIKNTKHGFSQEEIDDMAESIYHRPFEDLDDNEQQKVMERLDMEEGLPNSKESRRALGNERYGKEIQNTSDVDGMPLKVGDMVYIVGESGDTKYSIRKIGVGWIEISDGQRLNGDEVEKA